MNRLTYIVVLEYTIGQKKSTEDLKERRDVDSHPAGWRRRKGTDREKGTEYIEEYVRKTRKPSLSLSFFPLCFGGCLG